MFLITTADQRYWKPDEPVLFLGEWCLLYTEKAKWENIKYEILPYHWANRKKLYQDYLYLDELYEKILKELTDTLNDIHNEDHSTRYWRIIIGPWLFYFIQIVFDRYHSILNAEVSEKVTFTYIPEIVDTKWIVNSFLDYPKNFINDEYNLYLFSKVILHRNNFVYKVLPISDVNSSDKQSSIHRPKTRLVKNLFKHSVKLLSQSLPTFLNKIVFVSSYLDKINQVKLQLALKQFPYLNDFVLSIPDSPVDSTLREKIKLCNYHDDFEDFLYKQIPLQIPKINLEGYSKFKEEALSFYPKKPKICFTANAHYFNDGFKFWAAHWAEKSAKVVVSQHGGHYGMALWSSYEKHEILISDRYFTWGWSKELQQNVRPLPSGKLQEIRTTIKPKKGGRILLVLMAMPRYSYFLYSAPIAQNGYNQYFSTIEKFINNLKPELRNLLMLRLYPSDYSISQKKRFESLWPTITCVNDERTMYAQLNECCLFVGTYNATTYLETFSANYPTVLFWDPMYWELRDDAKYYFRKLENAGIFHPDPLSAAKYVNDIYTNPIEWWNTNTIQNAKDEFCKRFALTSKQWIADWRKELTELAS